MDIFKVLVWIAYIISLYFLVYWLMFFFEKRSNIQKELKKKTRLKETPLVSIIVPCYNEEKNVQKTMRSVLGLKYSNIELIVVNDGSTDRSEEKIKEFIKANKGHQITYIYQENKGKASALNNGLKIAKGSLFACLDADSFVHKDALGFMVEEHLDNPDLAIVTPILKIHQPKNVIQKFQRLEYMAAMLIIKLMGYMDSNYIAPGPFSVYKTDIIRKIGGFDEDNLVEDQEIAYRAQKSHYQIKQSTRSFVETVAPNNFNSLNKQRNRWFKGTIMNIIKYRSIIMNKDYGDFGVFQMPINIIAFGLALVAVFSFLYYTVKPLVMWLRDLYLVNFDIMPFIENLKLQFNILGFDYAVLLILGICLVLTVLILYFASRATKDRVRKYGILYIIPYFFIYFILLGYVITKVMIELLLGIKQKW